MKETGSDQVLGFTIPARHARGRVVRLGPVLDSILSAHDYPTAIRHLLAEALVLTTLLGSLLKDDGGQLTLQAQSEDGVVQLLVCDFRQGELRGYVSHDAERLAALARFPTMADLFGEGYLAITFDLATNDQRYQGIVPLEGASLTQACQSYFERSEQLPTLLRTGIRWDGQHCVAGGLLVQHLSEGEDGRERLHVRTDHPEWEHVATLAGSLRQDELVDRGLSLEAMIWRLLHEEEEVRVEPITAVSRGCRCSSAHFAAVLARFSEADRADMREPDGSIAVDCAFCSKIFRIAA